MNNLSMARQRPDAAEIKVLMYHRVAPSESMKSIHWSYVGVDQIRKHLELLRRWEFTPITFRDFALSMRDEISLPGRPVILTFEDARRAVRKLVFPLMRQYGMNAVMFALGDRSLETDEWAAGTGLAPEELATDEDLLDMHCAGFEIGSHSLNHVDLTTLNDNAAEKEIAGSKASLESLIQDNVMSFSYPYGAVDHRIKLAVEQAGYEFGCGIDTGSPQFGDDLLNIRRITITSMTNTLSLGMKLLAPVQLPGWRTVKEAGRKPREIEKSLRFA